MVFGWGWGGRRRGGFGPGQGYGPGYGPGYGRGGWGPQGGYGRGYGRGYGGGGGGSCLRDLLFLDAGCCAAEMLGCGPNLVLLAPIAARRTALPGHEHAPGNASRAGVAGRLIAVVRAYQREISPRRGPCCRFTPSCSAYAVQALERHGARRGTWLTARRLLRCRPGAAGGADPVPLVP